MNMTAVMVVLTAVACLISISLLLAVVIGNYYNHDIVKANRKGTPTVWWTSK